MTLIAMVQTSEGELGLIADRVAGECFAIADSTSKVGEVFYEDDILGRCRVLVGVSGEFFKLPISLIGELLDAPGDTSYAKLVSFANRLAEITRDSAISLIFKDRDSDEVLLSTIVYSEKEAGLSIVFPSITNAKSVHGSIYWAVANIPGYHEGVYLPFEQVADRLKSYSQTVFGAASLRRAYDIVF